MIFFSQKALHNLASGQFKKMKKLTRICMVKYSEKKKLFLGISILIKLSSFHIIILNLTDKQHRKPHKRVKTVHVPF